MSTKAKYRAGVLEYFDSSTHERVVPMAAVKFEDDFFGGDVVIPAAGSAESGTKWVKKIVGAAPPTVAKAANSANGIVACTLTSASQKQSADCYMDDQRNVDVEQRAVVEMIVRLSVLPTLVAECAWGLIGDWADGYDAITYSAFFTADGSGAINCEVDDNASNQAAASGITATAAQTKIYRIDFTDVTNVLFYIDGAHVATSTTFAYAATGANAVLQPFFGCYKASGAGLGTLLCDNTRIWQNRS